MAQQAKFSINVKPRARDQFLGTGIVYMSVLMDYSLEGGNAYLEKLGLVQPPGLVLVPLRHEITYHSPLLMSEEAKVSARTTRLGRSSAASEYQINEAKTERPIANILLNSVLIDIETGRSVPIPDEWRQKIIAFEGKENVEVA